MNRFELEQLVCFLLLFVPFVAAFYFAWIGYELMPITLLIFFIGMGYGYIMGNKLFGDKK